MPSHHNKNRNHISNDLSVEEVKKRAEDATADTLNNMVESTTEASKTMGGRIDEVREKAAEVYNNVQHEAQVYIEKGKQAVESAKGKTQEVVGSAKERAASIHQMTQEAVDSAKKTAQPYVDQAKTTAAPFAESARNVVETSKERVQAVKRGMDKRVEDVNSFDLTQTNAFAGAVVMMATVFTMIWAAITRVSSVKTAVLATRDKAAALGVSGKAWEAYYYATVMLEHVPVIGFRAAKVLRVYVEAVNDEATRQIRVNAVNESKKQS